MVLRGTKTYGNENSCYFMRYIFKDGTKIEFGRTFSFYEIQKKFRISKALLHNEVIIQCRKVNVNKKFFYFILKILFIFNCFKFG